MKTTTITIAALLVAFGSFAQQNVEQKKSEEIKKNPALYQSQGGVIDDSMLDLPAKTKKQDYVDPNGKFIIPQFLRIANYRPILDGAHGSREPPRLAGNP